MELQLIRKLMRYGELHIDVKEGEWFLALALREPSGAIGGIIYERGKRLQFVMQQLLEHAENEYKEILVRYKRGTQSELDLW